MRSPPSLELASLVTPLSGSSLGALGTHWPLEDERAVPGTYTAGLAGTGIRAELTAAAGEGLGKTHDYILRDGWRHVLIVSTYHNTGSEPVT